VHGHIKLFYLLSLPDKNNVSGLGLRVYPETTAPHEELDAGSLPKSDATMRETLNKLMMAQDF
jgi:hypothetical protein